MNKIFLIIIAFFVFIPFVSASVTFEEIKTELESKYGNSIQVEGSLKSGVIAFDPNNDRQVINIDDSTFTFHCGFDEDHFANNMDEFNEKNDKVNSCRRYGEAIRVIVDYILEKSNYEKVNVHNDYFSLYYNGYINDTGEIIYINDNNETAVSDFTIYTELDLNEFKPANNTSSINATLTDDNKVKISVKTNNSKIKYCYIYKSTDNVNYKLLKYIECSNGAEFTDDDVNLDANTYYYKANLNKFFNATTIDKYSPYSEVIEIKSSKDDKDNNTTNNTTSGTTNNTTNNTTSGTTNNTTNNTTSGTTNNTTQTDNKTENDDTKKNENSATKDGRTNPETGNFISIISIIFLVSLVVAIVIYTGKNKHIWRI